MTELGISTTKMLTTTLQTLRAWLAHLLPMVLALQAVWSFLFRWKKQEVWGKENDQILLAVKNNCDTGCQQLLRSLETPTHKSMPCAGPSDKLEPELKTVELQFSAQDSLLFQHMSASQREAVLAVSLTALINHSLQRSTAYQQDIIEICFKACFGCSELVEFIAQLFSATLLKQTAIQIGPKHVKKYSKAIFVQAFGDVSAKNIKLTENGMNHITLQFISFTQDLVQQQLASASMQTNGSSDIDNPERRFAHRCDSGDSLDVEQGHGAEAGKTGTGCTSEPSDAAPVACEPTEEVTSVALVCVSCDDNIDTAEAETFEDDIDTYQDDCLASDETRRGNLAIKALLEKINAQLVSKCGSDLTASIGAPKAITAMKEKDEWISQSRAVSHGLDFLLH